MINSILVLVVLAVGIPLLIWADRDVYKPRPYNWMRDHWYADNEILKERGRGSMFRHPSHNE